MPAHTHVGATALAALCAQLHVALDNFEWSLNLEWWGCMGPASCTAALLQTASTTTHLSMQSSGHPSFKPFFIYNRWLGSNAFKRTIIAAGTITEEKVTLLYLPTWAAYLKRKWYLPGQCKQNIQVSHSISGTLTRAGIRGP
eukprot:1161034-Pelagomonas_calceolata.AAC.15